MVTFNGVKIADKGFLINLKEREDRLKESIDEFNKINLLGVEVFEAIKHENPIFGCSYSHYNIMKKQVENKWEKVIIFEDDFMFDIMSKDIKNIDSQWIDSVCNSDYDVLFLGSTLIEKANNIYETLIEPKSFVQATSYIMTLKMAEFSVNLYKFWDEGHILHCDAIDTFFNILIKKRHWKDDRENIKGLKEIRENKFKIFHSNPIIFNQRPSFSNLRNQYVNYTLPNKSRNLTFSKK